MEIACTSARRHIDARGLGREAPATWRTAHPPCSTGARGPPCARSARPCSVPWPRRSRPCSRGRGSRRARTSGGGTPCCCHPPCRASQRGRSRRCLWMSPRACCRCVGRRGPLPIHRIYVCYRCQRVHGGAPTGVGDRVCARAPEARLDYRMGRRGWAQAPPTPAGAAYAARSSSSLRSASSSHASPPYAS